MRAGASLAHSRRLVEGQQVRLSARQRSAEGVVEGNGNKACRLICLSLETPH